MGGMSTASAPTFEIPPELYRRIVQGAAEAVIFSDRDGVIRLWNHGAEEIFGYTSDEALGRSLDLIVPERWRVRHWEGYRRVMASGVTRYGRELLAVPASRKDGSRISIEFSIVLPRDEEGRIAGAVAIVRDVTARWQEMQALRARIASLEPSPGPARA
jgi:PAS domain S-box-containing protein